jgi:hypothetical protein
MLLRRLAIFLAGCLIGAVSAQAQPLVPVVSGYFGGTGGFARDDSGHFFIADFWNNLLEEAALPGGQAQTLGAGLGPPVGVAADGAGNVFIVDNTNSAIKELFAASGYLTSRTIASGFSQPRGSPWTVGAISSSSIASISKR